MKTLLIILTLMFFTTTSRAQVYYQLYYNLELQAQVTANQVARVASEEAHKNSYEKQKDLYNEAKEKITQVVVIKNNLYGYLKNANAGLKQAKQVTYLFEDYQKLLNNMGKMLDLTIDHPEYAVLITRFYEKLTLQAIQAYESVSDLVMREEADYLMDSYDRQYVLNKLHSEVKAMNGWVLHINNFLSKADKKPFLRNIGVINNWYIRDKGLIEGIIKNSKDIQKI
jgi:hypothetical protein